MKNKLVIMFFSLLILFSMVMGFPTPKAMAVELSEGTYVVEYEVLQAEGDSVSIANDYFEKPATLTIDKDGQYVQFTVNHSKWIKVLKAGNGESFVDLYVVEEDLENDKRVVAFKVDGDLTAPLLMQMHVVIEEMEPKYDHQYSVRLDFDLETMAVTDEPGVDPDALASFLAADEESTNKTDGQTSNKVLIFILLALIAIAAIIFARKFSLSKQTK